MRLIDLDAIMAQFPDADFDGDVIENMKAYPYWKIGITGLINVLKAVPIIEQSEDCVSREDAIRIAEQGQIQGYEWQFKKLCNLSSVTPSYNSIKTELKPCEDCISREEAIRIAEQGQIQGYEWQFKKLCKLPSVTSKVEWIPVSERLPEESGDYLVTTKWKGSYSGDVYIETNMAVYRKKSKEWDCVDVIAWAPIPQPYAESEEWE